jgi:MYXO-CTERM domain-containing protein
VYWNRADAGYEGGLAWTTAFQSDSPISSAEWTIAVEKSGLYQVEIYVVPEYAQHTTARYELDHAKATTQLTVDLSQADGWHSLGEFSFEEIGEQKLTLFDNSDTPVADNTRIVVDAIRILPVASSGEDEETPSEEEPADEEESGNGTGEEPDRDQSDQEGDGAEPAGELVSGCQQGPGGTAWFYALLVLGAIFSLRRQR